MRDEGRDVWRVFLSRQAFPTALEHARVRPLACHCFCSVSHRRQQTHADKDVIRSAQADHLFSIGKYIPAAQLYARCSKSFEEVVLGFIDKGERDALRLYLLSRLERLPSTVSHPLRSLARSPS